MKKLQSNIKENDNYEFFVHLEKIQINWNIITYGRDKVIYANARPKFHVKREKEWKREEQLFSHSMQNSEHRAQSSNVPISIGF